MSFNDVLFYCILVGATALVALALIVVTLSAVDVWDGLQARRRARKARTDVQREYRLGMESNSDFALPALVLLAGLGFIAFWIYQSVTS